MQAERSQYTKLPGRLSRQLQRLTNTDKVVLSVLLVVGVYFYQELGLKGVILGALLMWVMLEQLDDVRTYDLIFVQAPIAFWWKFIRRSQLWTPGSKKSIIPYGIKRLPGTDIALTYGDRVENSVSAVVTGSGSPTMSYDIDGMVRSLQDFANILAKIVHKQGFSVEVGSVVRLRQWDTYPHEVYKHSAYATDVLVPKQLVSDEDSFSEAEQLAYEQHLYDREIMEMINAENAMKATMAITITMRRKQGGKNKPLYEDEVAQQPIIEVAANAQRLLVGHGVEDVTVLNVAGMQEYSREAWDNIGLDDFRVKLRSGSLPGHGHWPDEGIEANSSSVVMDGNHHALIRIRGTAEVGSPAYMFQIYGGPAIPKTVSLVTQSMRLRSEYWLQGLFIDLGDGIRQVAGRDRLRPKEERRRQGQLDRERSADESPHKQLYDIYVVVTADSQKALETNVKSMLDYYDQCNSIVAKRVVTLPPILYRLVWRALMGRT